MSDPRIDRLNVLVQRRLSSRRVLSETLLTFWHDENEPTPPARHMGHLTSYSDLFFLFFICSKPTAADFYSNDHCFYFNYVHFIVSLQQQLFTFSLNLRPRLKSSKLFVIGVCIYLQPCCFSWLICTAWESQLNVSSACRLITGRYSLAFYFFFWHFDLLQQQNRCLISSQS